MKNKIKIWPIFFTGLALTSSCKKDFLEVTPKGRLVAEKVADYDLLLNNSELIVMSTNSQVVMGDEIAAIEPYFSQSDLKTQRLFRWDDVIYESSENAKEMDVPMKNIYVYNKIIDELPTATDGSDQQKLSLQAEARAGRAWTYFLLINYFGKPYDPKSANVDLGFPLITKADVTATKFTRATVKEIYDFIVNELLQAIPNLPAKTSHRMRMSRAAGESLLGKVYLFMGKADLALPYFNSAMENVAVADIPLALYDYNKEFAPGGEFMPIGSYGPAYPRSGNNKENVYDKNSSNFWTFFNNELVINKRTVSLFDPTDLRLKFYSPTALYGPTYPGGLLRKMGPSAFNFGIILPDLYLLRAECKARLGDLNGSKLDVQELRKNRMPVANAAIPEAVAVKQLTLLKFIFEERIREFALSGYRWFDMRRLSVDPLFSNERYEHLRYSEKGDVISTYTLRSERFVLRFPQKVMDQNPGMQNNP